MLIKKIMTFDKITWKLIKYFIAIISIVILICFIGSSIFLSKFYISNKYDNLKATSESIYEVIKDGQSPNNLSVNALLIANDNVSFLGNTGNQGGGKRMGMLNNLSNINFASLGNKGKFTNRLGESFIYYKLSTEMGDIITFESDQDISYYLQVIYIVLVVIFLLALIVCIPFISYLGKKFTRPILQLKKASQEISMGNFAFPISITTGDEIEELSQCLSSMAINLQKRHKLQRDFIANVSHDFKTPLSVIRSYSEAIKDGIVNDYQVKEYSEEIIKEVDRLNNLVIGIMELSKLQGGELKLNKQNFNIENSLKECAERFSTVAKNKNIALILNSENVEVFGDEAYILRVLYNFTDNAIKFSKSNSHVYLKAYSVDNYVKVSVIDEGIGIEKEMLENVWNRYYKHAKSGGMGMGLAICAEILKLHNLSFGVESIPNEKTEFYFTIPKVIR
ncbi:signal transduction histidine-protein kinase BaeS [Clostridium homopropionicum DSM 5847]|uniref:histidine kinase n=1 Tax=Clostridium homopropionicum DSM 5847 TaxID=1121318 RepID=A0A0L6Z5A9_9CLOT|nr:HAMP domain-containing sensor histidine kinase [Clostridium homopropionicum]KOA18154.1 signal transduction histidine-protein kinase BaeS [Clostridium homopropionicum DSM 5847]SFG94923.1 Signal transduction histidine kinase [Clostridium homopropionicum]